MKKTDYKNHLDKIKCSPEFRAKMEERLSAEQDGEYADSVSDVERVTKINYHRWTAIAASAALVLGIGGTAVYLAKNSPAPPETMLSDSSYVENRSLIEVELTTEICNMDLIMYTNDSVYFNIANIPAEASNQIIKGLENCGWELAESDKFNDFDSETRLCISCTGTEEFVYTVNSDGYAILEQDDTQTFYYNENSYFKIVNTVAQYLPYCNWNSMVGGETGEKLDVIFKKHADEIKQTRSEVDSFDSWVMLMSNELYTVYIDRYGKITVFCDSGYGGSGSNTVSFSSSPEMYNEIVSELGEELGITVATEPATELTTEALSVNEYVYKLIDENISSEPMDLSFAVGSGQFDGSFDLKNIDMTEFIKAVKSHNWRISESSYPTSGFYIAKNIQLTVNGEIYDNRAGNMYEPADDSFSDLIYAVNRLVESDPCTQIMYYLSHSESNGTIMSGDITYFYSDIAEALHDNPQEQYIYRGGTGTLYHDSSCGEHFIINSSDGGYSAEYFEENREWIMIEKGNTIASYAPTVSDNDNTPRAVSSGFTGMGSCNMDYDNLCRFICNLIEDIYTTSDGLPTVDHRYDEATGCTVFSLTSTIYDTDTLNIYLNIANGQLVYAHVERTDFKSGETVVLYDFQIGDGMGGGITYYPENQDMYSKISEEMNTEKIGIAE
ncbi:MAG: hypothetical protein J6B75_02705 [Ruminococcus sp.]|nr:hypothetical protein [Ruminococcus sp.]